jgi:hypothetical protein
MIAGQLWAAELWPASREAAGGATAGATCDFVASPAGAGPDIQTISNSSSSAVSKTRGGASRDDRRLAQPRLSRIVAFAIMPSAPNCHGGIARSPATCEAC